METTISIPPDTAALQVLIAALAIVVFLAFSGWIKLLQQRWEVSSLSEKLPARYQGSLEKLAELLSFANARRAYNQGILWNLIETAESHLKPLRRLG